MSSIFSKIINGEIPCHKIAEDDKHLAFLDITPLAKGHTLVIPKIETDYVFDMADTDLADLIVFSKKVALLIKEAIPCKKVGVSIIGLEVPHAHIHLIPMNSISDMNFSGPKLQVSNDELAEISSLIRKS
ncbi:MAG: HIT family protein [Fluviicola sp.]|jgi:histidine triad (HIT) family protein|nr:HIT family protein [Fluviicola sp.]